MDHTNHSKTHEDLRKCYFAKSNNLILDFQEHNESEDVALMELKDSIGNKIQKLIVYKETEDASAQRVVEEARIKFNKLQERRAQLVKEVTKLRREVSEQQKQLDALAKCQDREIKHAAQVKERLDIARKKYQKTFNLNVKIVNASDGFLATISVHDKKFQVKFITNNSLTAIVDFDATVIMSQKDQAKYKAAFERTGNVPALLASIRDKVAQKP